MGSSPSRRVRRAHGPAHVAAAGMGGRFFYAPASLAGPSALRAANVRAHGQADAAPIRVCVDSARTVRGRPGITVQRLGGWKSRTQTHLSPPRERLEQALVAVASAKPDEDAAVALLADAVQQGRTTAGRLAAALEECPRLKHRRLLLEILRDVDAGAYSVLERHYLVRVERPHGLPTGKRQRRVQQGKSPAFRDVDYVDLATVVELDGRLGHEERRPVGRPGPRPLGCGGGRADATGRLGAGARALPARRHRGRHPPLPRLDLDPARVLRDVPGQPTSLQIRHLVPEK